MESFKVGDKVRILGGADGIPRFYIHKKYVSKCLENENPLCNLTTCSIVLIADANGKAYEVGDMRYSKEKGFHDYYGNAYPSDVFSSLNVFTHLDGWEELKAQKLTKSQIEKKLGHEIEIVDESEGK